MKNKFLALMLVLLFVIPMLFITVSAEQSVQIPFVSDSENFFIDSEKQRMENVLKDTSDRIGCPVAVATHAWNPSTRNDWGDGFLDGLGIYGKTDLILLILSKDGSTVHYDLYLFGNGEKNISGKEIDAILDDDAVFVNLKKSSFLAGVTGFCNAVEVYYPPKPLGRKMLSLLPVALIIGCIAGGVSCALIVRNYRGKHTPVEYPLDRFAKMDLTEQKDVFTGSFVTKRVINTNSSGGSSGGSHGGGHAGGR